MKSLLYVKKKKERVKEYKERYHRLDLKVSTDWLDYLFLSLSGAP